MAQFRRAVNEQEKQQQQLTLALLQNAANQFNFTFDKTEEMEGTQDYSNYSPAVTLTSDEPPQHDDDINNNGIGRQQEKDGEENTGDLVDESFSVIAFEKEIFLDSVRKYPCLWDVNCFAYKDRTIRNNAWAVLAQLFGKDVDFLQRQLKNLKDNLKKCLDKRSRMTKSGAPASVLPKCKYFEQMRFLHEKTANRSTETNLELVFPSSAQDQLPSAAHHTQQQHTLSPTSSNASSNLQSPTNSSSTSHGKRRKSSTEDFILKEISNVNTELKAAPEEKDCEDMLFCKSLVDTLKRLTAKKNRAAKIKINQILYEIEFEEKFE